ncbi:MAG: outer membrane protein OmpA-like peptidoglycan-associated protein [Arenicella sp.]|jgi:outer membrane protein OmpA-like peptidoglycan-associated protein/tetratricopeptide (TPR) repeat protein
MKSVFKILSFLILMVTFASAPIDSFAQSPGQVKKFVKKGRKAYNKGQFWKSKSYYDKVTSSTTQNPQFWLEAGVVYYESQVEREKSLLMFEKALEFSAAEDDTIPEIYYYKAKANHFNGEYEKAISDYNVFLNNVKNNKKGLELRKEVIREIEICNNGVDLRSQASNRFAEIKNMGPRVNSDSPDYAPAVTNDENLILFCSRRPPGTKKNVDGLYYEDIFYTTKRENGEWVQAEVIDKSSGYLAKEINEGKEHEAPISLSADGKTLFIYKENSIWKSELDDSGKWSIPRRMNSNVNIGTANPSVRITRDEQEMFIVSVGAAGGLGERDIYHTTKTENGGWAKPVNLGPKINTPFKEDAPFLSNDGKTLFFASEGHNSMGGFDIFKTVRDENGEWSDPINIGAPINSAGDDIYYVENSEGTLAYYASMRPGSYGYLDLYTASFECKNIPTTEIKGYAVFAENHLPVNGMIKITNKETGEEAGVYQTDPLTGKYNMVLAPEQTYYLELIVSQSRYNEVRPHREEFYIPKQCEYFNLYQEIAVDYLKDGGGSVYAQRAHFKNAMFDIESEIKKEYGDDLDLSGLGLTPENIVGLTGIIKHDATKTAEGVEVLLMNRSHQVMRMTETDENGEFSFEKTDPEGEYIIFINEDDAKISQFGDQMNTTSEVVIEGMIYTFKNKDKTVLDGIPVYLGNTNKVVVNASESSPSGQFKMSNIPTDQANVDMLNTSANAISYNLDLSDTEITYSAYITRIDPDNTELAYTEYIDIIELKDLPEDTITGGGSGIDFANILFDFDKFFLRAKSMTVLDAVTAFMTENPTVSIRLDGHTDWFGSPVYNDGLSERRALSAHKWLIDKGINPNRIQNQWFGEGTPTASNDMPDGADNESGRQLNRRVEIKVEIPEMADLYLSL